MDLSEFKGISQYNDAFSVSEYNNLIPLLNSCVDRLGEQLVNLPMEGTPRGTFLDSQGWVWIHFTYHILRFRLNELLNNDVQTVQRISTFLDVSAKEILFTESTYRVSMVNSLPDGTEQLSDTMTTQVYMTDGRQIVYFNTNNTDFGNTPYSEQDYRVTPFGLPTDNAPGFPAKPEKTLKITGMTWFDNRLIISDKHSNSIWITRTDPNWYRRLYAMEPIPGETGRWSENGADRLWIERIASTDQASNLNSVVSFSGMLYLFSDKNIETLSRTGTELQPLQLSPNSFLYTGGRNPIVLGDFLYFVALEQSGVEHVAVLNREGSLKVLSNIEIEKRLNSKIGKIYPLVQKNLSFILVYPNEESEPNQNWAFACNQDGFWWKWDNTESGEEMVRHGLFSNLGITNKGNVSLFTEKSRLFVSGNKMPRFLRDYFSTFTGRKILRSVEFICDTGRFLGAPELETSEENATWARFSFNRGANWSRHYFRKLSEIGKNDKVIIFRNCGSGNSICIEFGTGANAALQLHKINLQLA